MPRSQRFDDVRDIREHPIAAACAVGGVRLALHHPLAFKHRQAELGAADVDC